MEINQQGDRVAYQQFSKEYFPSKFATVFYTLAIYYNIDSARVTHQFHSVLVFKNKNSGDLLPVKLIDIRFGNQEFVASQHFLEGKLEIVHTYARQTERKISNVWNCLSTHHFEFMAIAFNEIHYFLIYNDWAQVAYSMICVYASNDFQSSFDFIKSVVGFNIETRSRNDEIVVCSILSERMSVLMFLNSSPP